MSYSNTVSRYRVTGNLIVIRGVVFASTRVSTGTAVWQQIEIPPLPNRAFQNISNAFLNAGFTLKLL